MIPITIAQHPTSEGVLLELTLATASAIIVYAKDSLTGKVYDIKEVLTEQTSHYVSLKIPMNHANTVIVARAIH